MTVFLIHPKTWKALNWASNSSCLGRWWCLPWKENKAKKKLSLNIFLLWILKTLENIVLIPLEPFFFFFFCIKYKHVEVAGKIRAYSDPTKAAWFSKSSQVKGLPVSCENSHTKTLWMFPSMSQSKFTTLSQPQIDSRKPIRIHHYIAQTIIPFLQEYWCSASSEQNKFSVYTEWETAVSISSPHSAGEFLGSLLVVLYLSLRTPVQVWAALKLEIWGEVRKKFHFLSNWIPQAIKDRGG